MKDDLIKIKITIPIAFDTPNKNGTIFTKDAVENAISNLSINTPIIYKDKESKYQDKVIGCVTDNISTWDFENQVCRVTLDGVVFHSGANIIINKIEDEKISDFKIQSIGLATADFMR